LDYLQIADPKKQCQLNKNFSRKFIFILSVQKLQFLLFLAPITTLFTLQTIYKLQPKRHLVACSLWTEEELGELLPEETFVSDQNFKAFIRALELVNVVPGGKTTMS